MRLPRQSNNPTINQQLNKIMKYNTVLTIAGSDSGGGAGIQADIKAISASGSYAASAITAITAQNTLGVIDVMPIPTNIITSQIDAVLSDIGANAIKIGMMHSSEVIKEVKKTLEKYNIPKIVVDPVMISTSGHRLIEESAVEALAKVLIPISSIITPNIPEAEILLGRKLQNVDQMRIAAKELSMTLSDGKIAVLIKGGHLRDSNEICDLLYDPTDKETYMFKGTKFDTPNTHGTGCSLSSAIAAHLSQSKSIYEAVEKAEAYIDTAIESGSNYTIGKGHGPIDHFYMIKK